MKKFRNRRMLCVFMLSILCFMLISPRPSLAEVAYDDLTGVQVAIYNGADVLLSSRIALTRMFEWMNASVTTINASQILDDCLDDYDILVIPGGPDSTLISELQYITGVQKIKEFIEEGGSYFGICGGAIYGANSVNLFDGSIRPVSEPGSTIHMTIMNINRTSIGPDLSDCPANLATCYWGSQYFDPNEGTNVHVIASYEYNGEAGMIAFEYGDGTVFLSSPHPEYEEDDNRDDTTFGDNLDDPESEWDLLFRVSKWLVEASIYEQTDSTTPTTPTTPTAPTTINNALDLPVIAVATTGVIVAALIAALLYRRMHG